MTEAAHPLAHLVEPPRHSPEPAMIDSTAVEVMRSYADRIGDFWVTPEISSKVERRIRNRVQLAEWEELIAVVDSTVIGDGRNFLAFTTGGLHVKEMLFSGPAFQSWDRILRHRADSLPARRSRIRIGEHVYWPSGTDADLDELASMIDEIGGWAAIPQQHFDTPRLESTSSESITTVVAASSTQELVESVYVFTYGWSHVMIAPTIKRVDADPVRDRLRIPPEETVLLIAEYSDNNRLALTERGLYGVRPNGDGRLMRTWEQVRGGSEPEVTKDDALEVADGSFDLSSMWFDHDELLDIVAFVALRAPR